MLKVPDEYLSYTERTSSSLAGKNCKKAICRRDQTDLIIIQLCFSPDIKLLFSRHSKDRRYFITGLKYKYLQDPGGTSWLVLTFWGIGYLFLGPGWDLPQESIAFHWNR